ncbi:hypothetical protein, partial [uncultured Succinivibrio sp.]|uniref:hypothetical protein n=1 Tax=uncultured Succinivibrio sp. TaxID=540749 RepID=UPI0025EA2C2D
MLCEELSKLPIFETCVSGHVSDKTSFRNVITDYWDSIKAQFKDLRYLTGDSSLCTSPIAKEAKAHGIKMVTRIPDKNDEATACRKMLKAHPEELVPVDENNPEGTKAMWCGEGKLGDETVKKLLVSQLKKLWTQPCKCKADAEQELKKTTAKLKLVKLTDAGISYEEVQKYTHKGRHGKDEQKVTVAVKVRAEVELDDTAIEQKIKEDTYYVICTNDVERNWTMAEL